MSSDLFIRVCRENTSILSSLLDILEAQREMVLDRLAKENDTVEMHRFQGEARKLSALQATLKQMVRMKDEDGTATDKSRIGGN